MLADHGRGFERKIVETFRCQSPGCDASITRDKPATSANVNAGAKLPDGWVLLGEGNGGMYDPRWYFCSAHAPQLVPVEPMASGDEEAG